MSKREMKPGTMLYPVPAVMVSLGNEETGYNIITIAWTGTINTQPPMTYISVRKERHSHAILTKTGSFVINLTSKDLVFQTDFCGVKSGSELDKFKEMKLTPIKASKVDSVMIEESPLNIECKITDVKNLGTHDMFLAEVVAVHADESLFDNNDAMQLNSRKLVAYSHGRYYELGKELGKFGYSIEKKKTRKKRQMAASKKGK